MKKININLDGQEKDVYYLETINVNGTDYAIIADFLDENTTDVFGAKIIETTDTVFLTNVDNDTDKMEIVDYIEKEYGEFELEGE